MNVVPITPKTAEEQKEETQTDLFIRDVVALIKANGRDKIVILTVDTSNNGYNHSLSANNMSSSECVALLELAKQGVINRM
jgi:hypothetical protein